MLEGGKISTQGEISKVIQQYYQNSNKKNEVSNQHIGSETVELLGAELVGLSGNLETTIHDEITIRMKYKIKKSIDARCVPNFHFFAPDGSYIFVSSADGISKLPLGIYQADCEIPGGLLNEGAYFVGVAITSYFDAGTYEVDFFERNALMFNVVDPMDERSNRYGYARPVPGILRPKLDWHVSGGDK